MRRVTGGLKLEMGRLRHGWLATFEKWMAPIFYEKWVANFVERWGGYVGSAPSRPGRSLSWNPDIFQNKNGKNTNTPKNLIILKSVFRIRIHRV
jgi:hypothetical protein